MYKNLIFLFVISLSFTCNRISDDKLLNKYYRPEIDSLQNKIEQALVNNSDDVPEKAIDSLITLSGKISVLQLARAYEQKTYLENIRRSHYSLALRYVDSVLQLTQPLIDIDDRVKNQYLIALFSKGDLNYNLGNYRLAFYYFVQAKRQGKELLNYCVNSDYDYRMAMILYRQERYEEAIQYYHATLDQQEKCNGYLTYLFRKQELLSNIGLSYTKLREYDSATKYYDLGLQYIQTKTKQGQLPKSLAETATGVIMGNKAKVLYAKGEVDKAISALNTNININGKRGGDNRDALSSIVFLAEIYREQRNIKLLSRNITRAQRILDSMPDPAFQRRIYFLSWKYNQMVNQKDIALQYAEKFIALNDSLNIVSRRLGNTDAQIWVEQLEKEFDFELLKKDVELRKNLTALFIIVIVLSLAILLITFFSLRSAGKKNKQLEQLNRDKDRMMGIVAHDLRDPISAVYSLTEMIMESSPNENSEQHELLKMIKIACNSSIDLIREILVTAEISGKKTKLEKQMVDVNEFLSTSINLIQFRAEEKHQEMVSDLLVISREINIDAEKFRRVIRNLIVNAIKFSPEYSKIKVSAEMREGKMLVKVKDKGIGIPDQLKDKIFDPFTTAKRAGTAGEKPIGLGLSIAKQIVEAHAGEIWFKTKEGEGTSFYVEIPV